MTANTYEVGDYITIKPLDKIRALPDYPRTEGLYFNVSEMAQYCGLEGRIIYATKSGKYLIDIDGGLWTWGNYMIEGISPPALEEWETLIFRGIYDF